MKHELATHRVRSHIGFGVLCWATVAGCAQSSKSAPSGATPQGSGTVESAPHPTFTAVVTASPTPTSVAQCIGDPGSTDPDTFKAGLGISPADLFARFGGSLQTTVTWGTIAPPDALASPAVVAVPAVTGAPAATAGAPAAAVTGAPADAGSAAAQESASLDFEYLGTSRFFSTCGKAELDLQVHLHAESSRLDITAPAVLATTTSNPENAQVRATLPLDALPDWRDAVEKVTLGPPRGFQLQVFLSKTSSRGEFSVLAPDGIGQCTLVSFPAMTQCDPAEQSVPGDQALSGLRAQDLLNALPAVEAPKNFFWEDTHTTTQVSIDFTSMANEACVGLGAPRPNGDSAYTYALPGRAHITTADHRVDITIPARANTQSVQGDWSPIVIQTASPTLIDPKQAVAFDFDTGGRRALSTFNSSMPMSFSDGSVIDQGSLHIDAMDLKSPSVTPTGALCATNWFLGVETPVATGDYLADGQKPPSP